MATLASKLSTANENTWMRLGALSELMHDPDKATYSYENALLHNPYNVKALTQIASICRLREQFSKAVEYFQRVLNIENNNGEIWGALGHCYLMMDDLQKAYAAYQQALYHLSNPKDPNLWYGIGILYDRYGSYDHAEEAFTAVLKMDAKFEKSNEIYFRLGIIYKQQMKNEQALECFRYILQKPPRPLSQADIWFQIGHIHELQKDFNAAKDAYERVLKENPTHAKSLQQLGWLYHSNTAMGNQDIAITFLMRSIDADPTDGQTWYLLGRCYMAQQQYRKAYDAYQQAVYRDGRNPTFWCSIGVLYYQINQYRDALDAYSRAIRLNPYLSEVWYDLGTLYESCNQISDSLDAYQRAAELDSGNKHIQQRLAALREAQNNPSKVAKNDATEQKDPNNVDHKEKTLMTMEPRATPPPPPNESTTRPHSNIPAVADLVDLSNDGTRTLPPTRDLHGLPPVQNESASAPAKEATDTNDKYPSTARNTTPSDEDKDESGSSPKDRDTMEIVEDEASDNESAHKSERNSDDNNNAKEKTSADEKNNSPAEGESKPKKRKAEDISEAKEGDAKASPDEKDPPEKASSKSSDDDEEDDDDDDHKARSKSDSGSQSSQSEEDDAKDSSQDADKN